MSSETRMSALASLKARRQQTASAGGAEAGPASTSGAAGSTAPTTVAEAKKPVKGSAGPSPPPPAAAPAGPPAPAAPLPTRQVESFSWLCGSCQRECVPVRSESRCLCGHRLKEHDPASSKTKSRCKSARCGCKDFFFVVAEGAWVLRCRCKHKHVEHDPATHACAKAGCACRTFDSPWVCNCDHPWSDHRQLVQIKEVISVRDLMGGLALAEVGGEGPAREVNDYDGLKRGGLGAQ